MKIGLAGTGGTGKSTLAELMAAHFELPFVPSVMRNVFQEKALKETDIPFLSPEEVWAIQKEGFDRKVQQEITPIGVFDRTMIDHYSYVLFRCAAFMNEATVMSMEAVTKLNAAKYDAIIYLPIPEWKAPADGFRDTGQATRIAIDAIVQGLLVKLRIPYFVCPDGTPEERLEFIKQVFEAGDLTKGRVFTDEGPSGAATQSEPTGDDQDPT